ncbi:hypothetical protein GCM10009748_23600 [Agromyces lapidis]
MNRNRDARFPYGGHVRAYRLPVTRVGTLSDAVATIVRNYTEETYVSQSELARRSGISQPHISNVFNGKTVFTLDQLDRVCDALGLQLISVIHEADVITRRD